MGWLNVGLQVWIIFLFIYVGFKFLFNMWTVVSVVLEYFASVKAEDNPVIRSSVGCLVGGSVDRKSSFLGRQWLAFGLVGGGVVGRFSVVDFKGDLDFLGVS